MKKKHIPYLLALVTLCVGIGYGIDEYLDRQEHQQNIATYGSLIPLVDIPKNASVTETADIVREFINGNSKHYMDKEFFDHWGKHDIIVQKMTAYVRGESDKPVHLECSSRGGAMELMLKSMDIKIRNINVWHHAQNFPAHTFLEVYDPQTKAWHVQDPGFDIFWKIKETGKRASAIELVKLGPDAVEPCHTETECGWDRDYKDAQANVNILWDYMGLAVIKDRTIGMRDLFVNETLFQLDKPAKVAEKGNIVYCEHMKKNCRGEITIY